MRARQRKKIIKNENAIIETFVTERLLENVKLTLIESHSWKSNDNIFEIRYAIKNCEWWNLIVYVNRKESTLSFELAFLPLDSIPVIKTEQFVETYSIGTFSVSEETFLTLKRKIDAVMKDEYYYIALKYSQKESLTLSEAKKWYNDFVEKYNSLISV